VPRDRKRANTCKNVFDSVGKISWWTLPGGEERRRDQINL